MIFVFQVWFVKYKKTQISQIEHLSHKSELHKSNVDLVQNVMQFVFQAAIFSCIDTVIGVISVKRDHYHDHWKAYRACVVLQWECSSLQTSCILEQSHCRNNQTLLELVAQSVVI